MIRKTTIFLRILILLVPALAISFSIYYLTSSHEELVQWYKGINSSFYKAEVWQFKFFTEKVKLTGNIWCLGAIMISLLWVVLSWNLPFIRHPKWKFNIFSGLFATKNPLWIMFFDIYFIEKMIIVLMGILFSLIMNLNSLYAFDEVFSAVNFASIPQFQSLSYYILPNNHIFFNVLNRSFFFWFDDLVATGRILSMLSYLMVLLLSWKFLKKWVDNAWLRWVLLLSIATQFPTWGFSGQARGYEMVLLFSCSSLVCFWGYWIENKTYMLMPLVTAIVLGMLTLPSFLYWMAGLIIASVLMMMEQKKIDRLYIRFFLAGMCILYLCYMPFFTFSGLSTMTDNQYMKATAGSSLEFIRKLLMEGSYFRKLFTEWFCFDILSRVPGYFLLLLPLVSLFNKSNTKHYRSLLKLYFSILLAFLIVCVVLKNMAFQRNMLAHGYLVWLVLLIVLSNLINQKKIQMAFGGLMLIATAFSTFENFKFRDYGLYYYNVRDKYASLDSCKFNIQSSSSVYLDNESFYWWYMLRQKFPDHNLKVASNLSSFKHQEYSILLGENSLFTDTSGYEKKLICHEFVVYRKRRQNIINNERK